MKKLVMMMLLMALLPLTAFSQTKNTKVQYTQARLLEVNANAYVKPLTVEIKINENIGKVSDTWQLSKNKVEEELNGNMDNVYSYAIYLSSKKHNADLMVAAIINFKTADNGDGYEVEITGFPANYVNWKTMTDDDLPWITLESTQTTDNAQANAIIQKDAANSNSILNKISRK